MIFYAIVEKETGSCFGVRFPDLPGCFSAADDETDILANAQVALGLYVSGELEVPRPRALVALRRDADVVAALAAGGFLMAVPLIVSDKKVRTNVMLDKALLAGIDGQAKAAGVSRSEYLSQAAAERLRADGAVIAERDKTGRLRARTA